MKLGLKGFSHSIGYGSYRDVEPVIGGLPSSKFYFVPLRERYIFTEVAYFISKFNADTYYKEVCNCETCKQVIGSDLENFSQFGDTKPSAKANSNSRFADREYPTGESVRLCRRHFLMARRNEIIKSSSSELDQLLLDLNHSHDTYKHIVGQSKLEHIKIWSDFLSRYA